MACMKPPALLLVDFEEVRHKQPDDCLHYESVAVRGNEMNWTIPAHHHEGLHQFQFLQKGGVRGTIDGREFKAVGPVLLMLAPGSVHAFTYTRHAVGHQVTLPTATLAQLLGGSMLVSGTLDQSFVIEKPAGTVELSGLLAQLAREFAGTSRGRVHALQALATLVAVHFVRERGEVFDRAQRPGARDTLVRRFMALVERHFASPQPLDFYAGQLGVTPDHLSRSCRLVSRKSALQMLQDRRMLEARRLLAYTPMPVVEVAVQIGFEDPAYFSRSFRREVGQSPTEYRTLVASGVRGGEPAGA